MSLDFSDEMKSVRAATDALNESNRIILAYKFEEARRDHPDGFTMDVYGNIVERERGYVVSITRDSFDNLGDALDTMARFQEAGFHPYLGWWNDNGQDMIDLNFITTSWEYAERLGRRLRQQAIWDFSTDSAIRLDYD